MMKYCCTILLVAAHLLSTAQSEKYDIATIPDAMKKNAYSVKRDERIEFEVKAVDKAVLRVHEAVTILNEAGKEELDFAETTDNFRSLGDFAIQLFDSKGKSIRKYSKSDLGKQAYGSGLVPDGKIYYLNIPAPEYPVTLVMDYEVKFNGLINYPDYQLQTPEQSVEHTSCTVKVPKELDIRYKQKNTSLEPAISSDDKYKVYNWSAANLPALEFESGSVSYESRYPKILIAPNKFELDGYEGDMSSWQSFGNWYRSLTKETLNLSEEKKKVLNDMVKGTADPKEKIKILYNYLQNNFRYVLIQLGIGGYKPFDADFVDKKKYGDCKALSNYMQACLNSVGIKSYQALINAEYNKAPVDPDFPHNSFNHVIICVPLSKDSVWLECTSSTTDFASLGNFTENRYALLITEDGGKLVATPKSTSSENQFYCSSIITLKEDGSGMAQVQLTSSGEFKQVFLNYIIEEKKDEQKKFIVDYLGFLQPDAFEINYNKADKQVPIKLEMSIEKVPEFTAGSKMFLNPRIYKLWTYALPKAENRTQDFYFQHPFIKTDTSVYVLPEGFGIETLPKAKNLQFEYGSFKTSYRFDEAKKSIVTTAILELQEYKIPAAKFAATKKFFNEVLAEFTEKIVIKKL